MCNLSANLIIKTLISFAVEIRSFLKFSASFSDLVVFFSSRKSILVKPSTKFVILGPKFSFNSNKILLNGKDVSRRIRETEVSEIVSEVSAVSIVREKMVNLQREIAAGNNVVLEGRDIGTRVFPNADFKFFLNADVKVRGKRRYKELASRGEIITLNEVIKKIELRDLKDSTRKHSPLEKAKNSIEIDTSNMSIKTQVEKIVSLINNNK